MTDRQDSGRCLLCYDMLFHVREVDELSFRLLVRTYVCVHVYLYGWLAGCPMVYPCIECLVYLSNCISVRELSVCLPRDRPTAIDSQQASQTSLPGPTPTIRLKQGGGAEE